MHESGAHDEPLLHAVRKALDQLVLPAAELEELEHLAHALAKARVLEPVKAAVEPEKLAAGQLFVDERAIGNEADRTEPW